MRNRLFATIVLATFAIMLGVSGAHAQLTITDSGNTTCAGCVGIKTENPAVELHVLQGGTEPTGLNSNTGLLVQNTSSSTAGSIINIMAGSTGNSQLFLGDSDSESAGRVTYSHASDVMRFFTNGAERFRIDSNGDVGMGITSPVADGLHIKRTTGAAANMLHLTNSGGSYIMFENTATEDDWYLTAAHNSPNGFIINSSVNSGPEFELTTDGDLTIQGSLTTASTTYPDYVFEPEYELMPLDELATYIATNSHLPKIPEAEQVDGGKKINMTELQVKLLEKVEELTLYTLQQQETINELNEQVAELKQAIAADK